MIVVRRVSKVERENEDALFELFQEFIKTTGVVARAYNCMIGNVPQIAIEMEFENLAAYEQHSIEFRKLPEAPALLKRFLELSGESVLDIWELAE